MSAVIGILNKHAIALAADSAVTITGEGDQKIINTANKIFTLSKYHPVGIMIYNSANFMNTPWEVIIKVYRDQLDDTSFDTLQEYHEDFIKFLEKKDYYSDQDGEKKILENFIDALFTDLLQNALEDFEFPDDLSEADKDEIKLLIEKEVNEAIKRYDKDEICSTFQDYTQRSFSAYIRDGFEKMIKDTFASREIELGENLKRKIRKFLFKATKSKDFRGFHTSGLVFVGYGDQQIYPKLIPLKLSFVVDGRLRYYIDTDMSANISNGVNTAAIRPFAQTDVINTILSGIAPDLQIIMNQNFDNFLNKYNNLLINHFEEENPDVAQALADLDLSNLSSQYQEANRKIRNLRYIRPLMRAVGSLSKEDLAEMAESLIYLTYLKRRFTFDEESVGGPVDVALITKGDGFIWMRRKHYFEPKLNHQFFKTYLK